jgi:MFS transporter, DHA1 family, multidrug resistance protein
MSLLLISHAYLANTFYRTFASSAPTSASIYIAKEFGVSAEISYLITTLFLIGYVVGPMIWGPGSELLGRRPIFWVAMTCYTLFHLGQALAPNMETLLVTRFFAGVFAVAPLTNCGGTFFFFLASYYSWVLK